MVLASVAGLVGVAAITAPSLRAPEEQVEARVGAALVEAGVEIDSPVALESSGGPAPVYSGRLRVLEAGGAVAGVRIAVRPDPADPAQRPPEWLFPSVDCDSPYPLTWLSDSDSSYRTTRADLAECVSQDDDEGVLVTIAWRRDAGQPTQGAAQDGGSTIGRQTWRIDPRGGVVWLHNGSGSGAVAGLTAEQQRAVAGTASLLDAV